MSRRFFTSKTKKEQLKQSVFQSMRRIRGRLDADVLKAAEEAALTLHAKQQGATDTKGDAVRTQATHAQAEQTPQQQAGQQETVPYDRNNAREAVAHFMMLSKENKRLCGKLMDMMQK